MHNDINALSEHILELDDVAGDFTAESIEALQSIANWSMNAARTHLKQDSDFQETALKLRTQIVDNYPQLNDNAVDNILLYVHFYSCR